MMEKSLSKIIIPELPEKLKGLSKEEERIQKEAVLFLKSDAGLRKMNFGVKS